MIAAAKAYPSVQFRHCGGLWTDKDPKNAGSYFGYIDEAQYLSGIVAAHTTKTKKFGFVAAKPIPQVLRNINSFTLGAHLVDPTITTKVIFTGDWSLAGSRGGGHELADATRVIDVITCHVDSPKVVIQTAEGRGDLHLRLSRRPVEARAEGLPHRGGMALGDDIHRLCQGHAGRDGRHRTSCAAG